MIVRVTCEKRQEGGGTSMQPAKERVFQAEGTPGAEAVSRRVPGGLRKVRRWRR